MAGSSSYPGALDNFSALSPTNLGDNDSTGRNHGERHDDLEAAVEAVQAELGVNPAGTAATVVARLDAVDSGLADYVSSSVFSDKGSLAAATGTATPTNLSVGSDGQILYADSGESTGLRWGDAPSGGGLNPFLLMGA